MPESAALIVTAACDAHWAHARQLVMSYAATLNIDLGYQNFEVEVETLPAMYGERGGLWLAYAEQAPLGCVAVRELDESTAELKRLYVLPAGRGEGLGRRLTLAALAGARASDYACLRLDTLGDMYAARTLYKALGFVEIEPYYESPVVGTTDMEIKLQ